MKVASTVRRGTVAKVSVMITRWQSTLPDGTFETGKAVYEAKQDRLLSHGVLVT